VKPILLIAVNFVREQRWPIFVLLLWVMLMAFLGLVSDIPRERDELLFIFKQVAVYVVVFSIFFGGSAIYNERKSRRILAVLSKAIARQQYLSGLIIGITIACGIYCFTLGLTGSWTLGQAGFPMQAVWFFMACLLSACMLAGTIALMFSTFLNPFLAAGATAIVLGVPAVAVVVPNIFSPAMAMRWGYSVPVYVLTSNIMQASFQNPGQLSWFPVGVAMLETFIFWILGAWIFSRVDVAVAVE
jgi:ABC-type transport system involved in multi-copper enzyme maturation permease subunit